MLKALSTYQRKFNRPYLELDPNKILLTSKGHVKLQLNISNITTKYTESKKYNDNEY